MFGLHKIGRYEILGHLASGGMGEVYLARTTGLGGFERHVVVKTLELDAADDDPFVAMFLDEARLVGGLHHQYIAPVYEVGRDDRGYFLVMDYVHGQSAQAVWDRSAERGIAIPLGFTLTVGSAVAAALHYAHVRRGRDGAPLDIVHRDVTLSNVMIGYDGAVKLIDFGIAKAANRSIATQGGCLKGKIGYLAPEQILGKAVDHRADVFALGVALYELTTMTRAFRDSSDFLAMDRTTKGELAPPSHRVARYPRELEQIVMKALSIDPEARYPDAAAMGCELEALAHRMNLGLGHGAIVGVMERLFEQRAEPWQPAIGSGQYDAEAAPHEAISDATIPMPAIIDPPPAPPVGMPIVARSARAWTAQAPTRRWWWPWLVAGAALAVAAMLAVLSRC